MPKSNLLFRSNPPRDLLLRILDEVGLGGEAVLHDLRWFSREHLRLQTLENWLSELEPYYFPCKARRFFYGRGDPTADWIITVLRHLLPLEGYELKSHERTHRNEKQTLYQISPVNPFRGQGEATGIAEQPCLTVEFL